MPIGIRTTYQGETILTPLPPEYRFATTFNRDGTGYSEYDGEFTYQYINQILSVVNNEGRSVTYKIVGGNVAVDVPVEGVTQTIIMNKQN